MPLNLHFANRRDLGIQAAEGSRHANNNARYFSGEGNEKQLSRHLKADRSARPRLIRVARAIAGVYVERRYSLLRFPERRQRLCISLVPTGTWERSGLGRVPRFARDPAHHLRVVTSTFNETPRAMDRILYCLSIVSPRHEVACSREPSTTMFARNKGQVADFPEILSRKIQFYDVCVKKIGEDRSW